MAESLAARLANLDLLGRLEGAAAWFRSCVGRGRLLVAAGLGAVSALAYAPFYAWPLLLLTFPVLVWLIDGAAYARRPWLTAAWIGWAFGFGFFLVGLHWIGFAFVVDSDRHAWLLPFVAVLFPGGLALFFALAAGVARLRWAGWARVLVLAAALAAVEWLRGHILTGFPWNLPGYVWSGTDTMFQLVSVTGIYGLSLVTLIAFLAPAAIVDADGRRLDARLALAVPPALLVALFVFGWARLPSAPAATFDKVAVRIVQPNVPQTEKWKREFFQRNWQVLVDLTRQPGLATRTVVVWPEAAPPLALLETPEALQVAAMVLPDRTTLLTGTIRIERGEKSRFFNSMAAVSGAGEVLATYDKAHLVPFGEYLPLYSLLEPLGVSQITGGGQGYTEGPGIRTLTIPGLPPFSPLICYELIFPDHVAAAEPRPEWLMTMTDDSWFGPWTGPYQHLGIAKVRAAEEGLAVVRAANTGVSAIIDPYGRITRSLGLDRTGILDGELPRPLQRTLYSIAGDVIFFLMLLAVTAVGIIFSKGLAHKDS
jgi:apolipoprotein N-acyltransferase